jgi:hypothetical protein
VPCAGVPWWRGGGVPEVARWRCPGVPWWRGPHLRSVARSRRSRGGGGPHLRSVAWSRGPGVAECASHLFPLRDKVVVELAPLVLVYVDVLRHHACEAAQLWGR